MPELDTSVPAEVLALWSGGVAAAAAIVVRWGIVGPGFTRLAAGTAALFALPAWLIESETVALAALIAMVGAVVFGGARPAAMLLLVGGAVAMLLVADDAVPARLTGALLLGGVTSTMLLGHWYLVDPRLPRWALRGLTAAAGAGLVVDVVQLAARGALSWAAEDAILGWAFVALAAMTAVLLVGVWFALREPAYAGVMAATGLSYLAVLTASGVALVGRVLLGEIG